MLRVLNTLRTDLHSALRARSPVQSTVSKATLCTNCIYSMPSEQPFEGSPKPGKQADFSKVFLLENVVSVILVY